MTMRRLALILSVGIGLLVVVCTLLPTAAFADFGSFADPTDPVKANYTTWATTAAEYARKIYWALLIFEIIAIGFTTILFRENLGELFGSFTLKIFTGGLYFWFIDNAAGGVQWPSVIVNLFQSFGKGLGGTDSPTALFGLGTLSAGAIFEAGSFAKAIDEGQASAADTFPNCYYFDAYAPAYCHVVTPGLNAGNHSLYTLLCSGVAFIIVSAVAAILLQFVMITIESYFVMSIGILFIGFSASRFTAQYAQGYFSYMINVGVKIMVLYIVLGIEASYFKVILAGSAITALTSVVAFNPGNSFLFVPYDGLATGATYLSLAVTAVETVIAAGLIWMLPGLASSLLTGQSSASGAAVLQQAVSSLAGASQAMTQFGAASKAESRSKESRSERNELSAAGASNGQAVSGAGADNMGGRQEGPSFAGLAGAGGGATGGAGAPGATGTNGTSSTGGAMGGLNSSTGSNARPQERTNGRGEAPPTAAPPRQLPQPAQTASGGDDLRLTRPAALGGNGQSPLPAVGSGFTRFDNPADSATPPALPPNTQTGQNLNTSAPAIGSSDTARGYGEMTEAQIGAIHDKAEAKRLAAATDPSTLGYDQRRGMINNPITREAMRERLTESIDEARQQEMFADAYGLSGLAQGMPREIGQPTAVQVRISNPDKL